MKYIFTLFILLIFVQLKTYADYEIKVTNQQISTEAFLFDVMIKSTGQDFLLGSYQCIFDFNNAIANLGHLEFKYIDNTSDLNNEPIITSIEDDEGQLNLCFAANVGRDSINSENIKIGSFILYGNFPGQLNQDSIDLKWSFIGNIKTIIADIEFNDITYPEKHIIQEIPLPVELVSFNAEQIKEKVELNWETATELNSYGFEVQRKLSEEQNFVEVGFIKSRGGDFNQKYKFTDTESLQPGKYIYRLKQIDNDGTYEYLQSVEVVVNKPAAYKLYQNYPNPFNPTTTIKYSLKERSRVELNIYDITGQLIINLSDNTIQESGLYSVNWNADGIASGIYICQFRTISEESNELYTSITKMILMK